MTIEVLEERLLLAQSAADSAAGGSSVQPSLNLPTPPASLVTMLAGLKDLDLTSSRMREFDHLPPTLFRSLCVANLDYNGFTPLGLRGLRDLPRLQVSRCYDLRHISLPHVTCARYIYCSINTMNKIHSCSGSCRPSA